ncbi:TetR/AcrR family transcriptional regulator [Geodermatophilus sp. CPCC 205761]|uniref:TetR/AcrR family transcriptional regulator n=1 Tax=Geodermatophilus sp. CPCC 205761 TaxID=2936597 RepID=UPI003EEA5434
MAQRRRRLLDVGMILEAALALIDEHGRLTMGELAGRLGSSASSIYHHVSGRAEIVELIRERLATQVDLPPLDGTDWAAQVTAWMHSYRRGLAAHPNLIPLLIGQTMTAGAALEGYDRVAALLAAAGCPADEVVLWVTVLDSYAVGAALELASPVDVWRSEGGRTPVLDAAVQAGPRGEARADAAFDLGLAAILTGMQQRLAGLPVPDRAD